MFGNIFAGFGMKFDFLQGGLPNLLVRWLVIDIIIIVIIAVVIVIVIIIIVSRR